jgi:hypothetical protein
LFFYTQLNISSNCILWLPEKSILSNV